MNEYLFPTSAQTELQRTSCLELGLGLASHVSDDVSRRRIDCEGRKVSWWESRLPGVTRLTRRKDLGVLRLCVLETDVAQVRGDVVLFAPDGFLISSSNTLSSRPSSIRNRNIPCSAART